MADAVEGDAVEDPASTLDEHDQGLADTVMRLIKSSEAMELAARVGLPTQVSVMQIFCCCCCWNISVNRLRETGT